MKCALCGSEMEKIPNDGYMEPGSVIERCIYGCYTFITYRGGNTCEEFTIRLTLGWREYLEVDVENRTEYIYARKHKSRKQYSILRIDGWELHRYDFLVPIGTTDLNALEQRQGISWT